jgi:phosphoglycolate phosphatase
MVLLFDLDGTLTDPGIGILASTRYALAELGKSCPSDAVLASFIGPPLRNMFRTILETSDNGMIEEAVRLYRKRYTDVGIYESYVYDGVPAMLRRVRCRASKVFLATSKPAVFADRIVKHFELTPYFDGIYGTELNGRFDDKADLLGDLVAREDVRGDALMVGDRAADIIVPGKTASDLSVSCGAMAPPRNS